MHPKLCPNEFQERPSGASGMQENLSAVSGRGSAYSALIDPLPSGEGLAVPSPKTPPPLSGLLVLASDPK